MEPSFQSFSDELTKIAATRYEREIAAGNVSRGQVTPGVIDGLGPVSRKLTRMRLSAPTASQGPGGDRMTSGIAAVQRSAEGPQAAKMFPGFGPATVAGQVYSPSTSGQFLRTATSGPVGAVRAAVATLPDLDRAPLLKKRAPVDTALDHAVLRHEQGEKKLIQESGTKGVRPVASHLGPTPILNEQQAIRGNPEAIRVMGRVRQIHPDDALMQKLVRQAGGTPDAPLPTGGRHERALNRMIDRNVSKLAPSTRLKALQIAQAGGYVPYLPQDVAGPLSAGSGSFLQRAKTLGGGALRRLKFIVRGR